MKAHQNRQSNNIFINGPVAQLVRAPACHAGGRRFEPVLGRHFLPLISKGNLYALVAQSVEQQTENLPVGGSIPPQGTTERGSRLRIGATRVAGVAQLAEQLICNQQVVGSSPITGSNQKNVIKMGRFQSGQMDQTVNLTSSTSVVRIHLCPPNHGIYAKNSA